MRSSFGPYFWLTKPRLLFLNLIAGAAGYVLGAEGMIAWESLILMSLGLFFVMASGVVFNNVIDRRIDAMMERTKDRATVTGVISKQAAILYGSLLGIMGFIVLIFFTNILAVIATGVAFFFYIVVYSLAKRRSVHGALLGSISGAMPPVVGYLAATNSFDTGALLLFLILIFWQMPHFYAISIYRQDDYKNAGIPVMPLGRGIYATKVQMGFYAASFIVASLLLTYFFYAGSLYFVLMCSAGVGWLLLTLAGFLIRDDKKWARKIFFYSIFLLLIFCVLIFTSSHIYI